MHKIPQRQVHLDFHTSGVIENIGKKFDKQNFISCLKKGHVNSITVFAKCHHGWSYYPSKVNAMHPHLDFDLLGEQLKACKEAGVASPVYISVGFDDKYFFEHPAHSVKWTEEHVQPETKFKDGLPYADEEYFGFHRLCLNTPYLDEVLKQTEEVIKLYNPEGLFFDIVGEAECHCDYCKQSIKELGWDVKDPKSYKKLAVLTYKKYYEAIEKTAKSLNPNIKIFHNGGHISCGRRELAYTNTHLELESLPTGSWGYDHFPKSAKYVHALGLDYLGMTGKFHRSWGEFGGFKHKNALKYEVALNLAFGAKCSVGDQMHPLGFMDEATYELIGEAYSDAEKVEEYCYNVTPLADVGVLAVEGVLQKDGIAKHHKDLLADTGASRILLEGKYLFDILDSDCAFDKYKVIILPDDIYLKDENLIAKLKAFVAIGGKILATGSSAIDASKYFDIGVKNVVESEYNPSYYSPVYNALGLTPTNYVIYSKMYKAELSNRDLEVLAYGKETYFNRDKYHYCSHCHTPFTLEDITVASVIGKEGGYIGFDIFNEYAKYGCYVAKEAVILVLDKLLGENKTLKTNLPSVGVVALNDQTDKNRMVLHSLYACPIKRGNEDTSLEVIEDLIPIKNTKFEIKTDKRVKSVVLVPENKKIPFKYGNGVLKFELKEFTCKQVVVINYK